MNIFEDLVRDNKNLLYDILNHLSDILALHEERLKRITLSHAHDRVTQAIYYLTESLGQKESNSTVINCPITAAEIAKISGTSRETVSAVLKKLPLRRRYQSNEQADHDQSAGIFYVGIYEKSSRRQAG